MKWIPLCLIAISIIALIASWRMDKTSSFEDGSFIFQILLLLGGGGGFVVGAVWLLIMGLAKL